jgi:hypothetical protein
MLYIAFGIIRGKSWNILPADMGALLYNTFSPMRMEILRVELLMIQVFWDVPLCRWVSGSTCSEGSYHLHGHAVQNLWTA